MATQSVVTTTSKQFTLNWIDWLHSLFVGIAGAIASPLLTYLETNNFSYNFNAMWHVALMAMISYILRALVKPSQTIIASNPPLSGTPVASVKFLDESGTEIPTKPPPNT